MFHLPWVLAAHLWGSADAVQGQSARTDRRGECSRKESCGERDLFLVFIILCSFQRPPPQQPRESPVRSPSESPKVCTPPPPAVQPMKNKWKSSGRRLARSMSICEGAKFSIFGPMIPCFTNFSYCLMIHKCIMTSRKEHDWWYVWLQNTPTRLL